jgi:hypothetical protein
LSRFFKLIQRLLDRSLAVSVVLPEQADARIYLSMFQVRRVIDAKSELLFCSDQFPVVPKLAAAGIEKLCDLPRRNIGQASFTCA